MEPVKLTLLILLLNIGLTEQMAMQCSSLYDTGTDAKFCYYYKNNTLSWTDSYNQCLTRTIDGILLQIFSTEQFNLLIKANLGGTSMFWLGANNFASFRDSNWYWIDGSAVDNTIITWCADSTYKEATGTQCAVYDSTRQCVTNYLCSTLFSAPCVSSIASVNTQAKISLTPRATSTYLCMSTFGGAYAYWWTYSVLLINWFTLFCFFLYICNRFFINKNTIILTTAVVIVSFILIIVFAVLWGIQYQDIIQIPLATVIIACLASTLVLIVLFILLNNRDRVQRFLACMIFLIITILVEVFLMLGLILCVAYCSGYITLSWTSLDKDITASLLATLTAAVSILFYTGILYLLENTGQDRVHAIKPLNANIVPAAVVVPPRPSHSNLVTTNQRPNPAAAAPVRRVEKIERATSPVDERILNEFYSDRPKDVHQYSLDGRQYVVYEGANLTDIETYRNELTQAMLIQEPRGLREAIDRAKSSIHASTLAEEIRQAQGLAAKLG